MHSIETINYTVNFYLYFFAYFIFHFVWLILFLPVKFNFICSIHFQTNWRALYSATKTEKKCAKKKIDQKKVFSFAKITKQLIHLFIRKRKVLQPKITESALKLAKLFDDKTISSIKLRWLEPTQENQILLHSNKMKFKIVWFIFDRLNSLVNLMAITT